MKILVLLSLCSLVGITLANGLFPQDPNVISLTDKSLNENVLNQKRVTVAFFYAHWCGHCIRTSAIVKALAQQIQNWQKVVHVVALDCATYDDVCTNLKIANYPQFVFFRAQSSSFNDGQNVDIYEMRTQAQLYDVVRKFVISDPFIVNHYVLASVFVTKKEEICNTLGNFKKSVASYVIVETNPSVTSAEILLDLLPYRASAQIQRFYSGRHLFLDIHIYLPAILEVNLNSCTFKAFNNFGQDLKNQKQEFVNYIKDHYPAEANLGPNVEAHNEVIRVTKHKLTYIDLYNALRYSLLKEVPRFEHFNRTQVLVIKRYFSVILKYFPFRNENVRRLFKRMNIWFVNKNDSFKAVQYREAMRISDGFLKPMESWRHCNGSKPIYRGYPCGLWVLAHALTVGEYHSLQKNGSAKPEVLPVFRDYVRTFFSCGDCADHFSQATRGMESELIYPNSSVLFLWRIHNQVNHRLQGDPTEDPCFPKVQFPSKAMCERCIDGDQFNATEVLSFLVNYYDKKSIQSGFIPRSLSPSWFLLVLVTALLQFYQVEL